VGLPDIDKVGHRRHPSMPGRRIVRMRVLLTGANGCIGLRLLPELLARGHHVFTIVRDRRRLLVAEFEKMPGRIETIEIDLLESPLSFPKEIDVAYYLVHSLGSGGDFASREERLRRISQRLLHGRSAAN
jgi:uncharacterized protein YbjT (DUF2867 family)